MPPKAKARVGRGALRRPAGARPGAGGSSWAKRRLEETGSTRGGYDPRGSGGKCVCALKDIMSEQFLGAHIVVTEADYFGANL